MAEREDKNKINSTDDPQEKSEDFNEESLLDLSGEESGDEPVPGPPVDAAKDDDYLHRGGGISVDDVLAKKRPLELKPPEPEIEAIPDVQKPAPLTESDRGAPDSTETPPVKAAPARKKKKKRPLEIRTMPSGEGKWPVKESDPKALEALVRANKFEVKPIPGEKVPVDHAHLTKLDASLKEELKKIRKKAERAVIPGEFLEARRLLTEEGVLECPVCKIRVQDRPGKVDLCPKCGLALDDYLGQYKAEWERKHKHRASTVAKELFPPKKKRKKTAWEIWKEEQGLDPEAELLACPQCSYETYDDPFVATKCPRCKIPLDLHLKFPRAYIREREKHTRGRRAGMIKKKKQKK